jgi:3-ketosteroid 9alpha-monooxygenase subunit B
MQAASRSLPEAFPVTVAHVAQESPDTVTLYLDPHGHRAYRAGQYVGITPHQFSELHGLIARLEAEKGRREPQRKYSMASAPHEPLLALTVKEEPFLPGVTRYPPLLSGHLVRGMKPGDGFEVFGYAGPYVLPDDVAARAELVVHVVAGAGAVPNFSILKDALHRDLSVRHLWLASNKRREDILFHDRLLELQWQHPDRLTVVNTLTRDPDAPAPFRQGRVGEALLAELLPPLHRERCLVYACGPAVHPWDRRAALEAGTEVTPRFMETVVGHLHSLGVDERRIKRETYG